MSSSAPRGSLKVATAEPAPPAAGPCDWNVMMIGVCPFDGREFSIPNAVCEPWSIAVKTRKPFSVPTNAPLAFTSRSASALAALPSVAVSGAVDSEAAAFCATSLPSMPNPIHVPP